MIRNVYNSADDRPTPAGPSLRGPGSFVRPLRLINGMKVCSVAKVRRTRHHPVAGCALRSVDGLDLAGADVAIDGVGQVEGLALAVLLRTTSRPSSGSNATTVAVRR
jgi:hypothetical protein